jgi:hypothetical protein
MKESDYMDDRLNNEHDLGYKSLLSHKKTFMEFLKDFVKKDWVKEIEEDNLVLIDKEFILDDFKEEEADIVYKVNINGKDIIFYILFELQSKVDYRMPIRLLMYMTEIWRDELNNTEKNVKKRKDYRLPAIVPIVLYNGKNNWTAARSFKEILSGYELFEDNIIDFKYMLFDINRMDPEELLDIASVISSVFSLDQTNIDDEEIVKRLKSIGRFISRSSNTEQIKLFRNWVIGILRKRYEDKIGDEIINFINKTSEMEVIDMVSNLGKNLEQSINRKVKKAEEKAEEKARIEMAEEMILDGEENEKIIKYTKLSLNTINSIRERLLNNTKH